MEMDGRMIDVLKEVGVGQRTLNDAFFQHDEPLPKFGIFDSDIEALCHDRMQTVCHIPGCKFTAETLLEFENHYNALHRYSCKQCKKVLPSPHLLDLHIQETHDSYFAVLSMKKPSYCCYNEDCEEKFMTAHERLMHCVKEHRLPKDFRFDQSSLKTNNFKNKEINKARIKMNLDSSEKSSHVETNCNSNISLKNNKQKTFLTGSTSGGIDIDRAMSDLKKNLPE